MVFKKGQKGKSRKYNNMLFRSIKKYNTMNKGGKIKNNKKLMKLYKYNYEFKP